MTNYCTENLKQNDATIITNNNKQIRLTKERIHSDSCDRQGNDALIENTFPIDIAFVTLVPRLAINTPL